MLRDPGKCQAAAAASALRLWWSCSEWAQSWCGWELVSSTSGEKGFLPANLYLESLWSRQSRWAWTLTQQCCVSVSLPSSQIQALLTSFNSPPWTKYWPAGWEYLFWSSGTKASERTVECSWTRCWWTGGCRCSDPLACTPCPSS